MITWRQVEAPSACHQNTDSLVLCIWQDKLSPVCYVQISSLENTDPQVNEAFRNGGFSAQVQSKNPVGGPRVGPALEATVSRNFNTTRHMQDSVGSHGSQSLLRNLRAQKCILGQLRNMIDEDTPLIIAPWSPGIKNWQSWRSSFIIGLIGSRKTLFLVNITVTISLGKVATPDVAWNLLNAPDVGKKWSETFKKKV